MVGKYFKNSTILKILDKYKDLWSLSHISALGHWDLETYMPSKAISHRSYALSKLATIKQRLFLDKNFVSLLHKSYNIKQLTDQEQGVVRILMRSLKFYEKVPPKFLEEFENLTSKSTIVWAEAKNKSDFKLFEPSLKKIFDMSRQMAEYLGYSNSPYDALLDQYEEDLTVSVVESFFTSIREPLQTLLKKITTSKNYSKNHFLGKTKYDKRKLKELNKKILKNLWPQFGENFRLDVSAHPFTTSFSNQDTRITTWYHERDFARSLMAVVHEFGHALYDLQSADELEMTPIAGGSSLVIHESQSRFWENHIGRSMDFIKKYLPDFRVVTNRQSLMANDLFSYFNQVKPSLLRVEADEVTYHFHIMLRYEIERDLIESRFKIQDLREVWNAKMKEYLGITPKKDSEGILQDIHWAHGSVGYFPTYSLGTFLAANWIGKDKKWLKVHIHKYGSTYTLDDLLKKNAMKFDPSINLKYLEEKYSKIYNF